MPQPGPGGRALVRTEDLVFPALGKEGILVLSIFNPM